MNNLFIYLIILVTIFGLFRTILKKKRILITNKWTILAVDSVIITTIILLLSSYMIGPSKMLNDIKNIDYNTWVLTITISIVIVFAIFTQYYLLYSLELSKFKPIIVAFKLIFFIILGKLLFNEDLTFNKIIGCIFILFGICFIAY